MVDRQAGRHSSEALSRYGKGPSDTQTIRNIEYACAATFATKFDPIRNCPLPVRFPVVLSARSKAQPDGDGNTGEANEIETAHSRWLRHNGFKHRRRAGRSLRYWW